MQGLKLCMPDRVWSSKDSSMTLESKTKKGLIYIFDMMHYTDIESILTYLTVEAN